MNCIIIDDEPLAIKVIEKHLSVLEGLHLVGTFNSALPVYKFLKEHRVDLLFLDIEMPNLSGLNFINSLHDHPQIILTTAHREYAVESYKYAIVDYLLKPISFERFLKAIGKVRTNLVAPQEATLAQNVSHAFFKVDRRNVRIDFSDILYIESLKNHVKLVLANDTFITLMNLQEVESKLNSELFVRVHKSYIVAIDQIQSYNKANILINNLAIPIGRSYKLGVLQRLDQRSF